jgi:RNase P/RNase MRP subunit p29
MPTPGTLPRHGLIGLPVRVADATHDGYVGLAGRVVDETKRTLAVDDSGAGVRQIPKAAATFEFACPARTMTPRRAMRGRQTSS